MGGRGTISQHRFPSPVLTPLEMDLAPAIVTPNARTTPFHPLTALFTRLDRLFESARQIGAAHPATQSRIPAVFKALTQALDESPASVHWQVLPYCFVQGNDTIWEPAPPGDVVPYMLSAAGLREVRIVPGVDAVELRELLSAMMIERDGDPAEIAAMLWEAPFHHIFCHIDDEIGGVDAQSLEDFFAEAAEVEKTARAAMGTTARSIALDPAQIQELAQQIRAPREQIAERHGLALVAAMSDVVLRRDPTTLQRPLAGYANRLLRVGRYDELFATHQSLVDTASSWPGAGTPPPAELVTSLLFTADALVHVVRLAASGDDQLGEEQHARVVDGLSGVSRTLGAGALDLCIRLIERLPYGPVVDVLVDYVARTGSGREQQVLERLEALSLPTAERVLAGMLSHGGEPVREALKPLLSSASPALRCEAIAQLATSQQQLAAELMILFQGPDQCERLAALATFVRHRVMSAGPALVHVVSADAFRQRPLDEQQAVFEAMFTLHPSRTEGLLGASLERHGVVVDHAVDRSRALAARLLGERATTAAALAALHETSRVRPWNSAELREVAKRAAEAIHSRLGSTPGGGAS